MAENSKTENVNKVYVAGDYAVMECGELYFYYGYEHIWCCDHKRFADRCGDDCETEWAFTAKKNGKLTVESRRSQDIDEFSVAEQLIFGLGGFIQGAGSAAGERRA